MHDWERARILLGAGLLVAATAVTTLPTTAVAGAGVAGPPAEEHCVLVVRRAEEGTALAADFAIGVHYDGAGFTGSSVTVVGSSCIGGWLNLPAAWNDRISSTANGCPQIRHFLHVNLAGTSASTFSPGGNLGALSNEASSIQYLP
jgi:hypothetical protein